MFSGTILFLPTDYQYAEMGFHGKCAGFFGVASGRFDSDDDNTFFE
jgi:hypothetical protein